MSEKCISMRCDVTKSIPGADDHGGLRNNTNNLVEGSVRYCIINSSEPLKKTQRDDTSVEIDSSFYEKCFICLLWCLSLGIFLLHDCTEALSSARAVLYIRT